MTYDDQRTSHPWRVTKFFADTWDMMRARPIAVLGIMVLLLIVSGAALADVVATYDPLVQDVAQRLKPPDREHYFGTDGFGRDIFSRVVHGARVSLLVGFGAVAIAAAFGISIGTLSAYSGGKPDLLVQRAIDVMLGFPTLVLALIITVSLGPSSIAVFTALALAFTPQITRLIRAAVLSIKEETYVEAARAVGAGSFRIIWRHMLPNSFAPVLVQLTGYIGAAVVAESALSFMGLGVPPPSPSWGRMLHEGVSQYFEAAPWATIFPGLALSATVFSSALLGDEVRSWADRRSTGAI